MYDPLADLRALIAATPGAVTVVFGAYSTPAILDFEGQGWGGPEDQAQIGVEIITLTFCYPDLPGLAPGSAITAGGVPYVISRGPRRLDDGLETTAILENA